jgi:wobble nucleotide-excising tRNase
VWDCRKTPFQRNILPSSSGCRQYLLLKHWYLPTSPHGVTDQKTNISILIVLRHLIYFYCSFQITYLNASYFSHSKGRTYTMKMSENYMQKRIYKNNKKRIK